MCHDLVIGARRVKTAAAREVEKIAKHSGQVVAAGYRFTPFGVDTGGEIGGAAAATLAGWARSLTASRKAAGLPLGSPATDVRVAAGRAFVRASVSQVFAWAGSASRIVSSG